MANGTTGGVVVAGDHTCLTFTDAEQRLDLLAAFVGEAADWQGVEAVA